MAFTGTVHDHSETLTADDYHTLERLQTEASVDTEDRNAKHAIPLVGDFDSETGALTATQTRCP